MDSNTHRTLQRKTQTSCLGAISGNDMSHVSAWTALSRARNSLHQAGPAKESVPRLELFAVA